MTIVVLSNRSDIDPDTYIDAITDIYLPELGYEFRPADTMKAIHRKQRLVPTDDICRQLTGRLGRMVSFAHNMALFCIS